MQISVSGKNIDTGLAFQEHAEKSLNTVVEKYFHNAVSGQVTLEKADSGFTVKTRVALSRRMELSLPAVLLMLMQHSTQRWSTQKKGFGGTRED